MIRASRVEEDRAALDRGSNEKVAATIDIADAMQLELAHEVTTDGKATVQLRGELDIATADRAFAYLCDVVDSQQGPVTVNLADLTFCDAAGLGVLARVAG
ncbi:MAG: STAS domain-containing protein, partial [Trebonia sp.]